MTTRRDWMKQAAALALGAMPGAAACGGAKVDERHWFNAVASDGITPNRLATPLSASDIVAAVVEAEKRAGRIRMTGSGHSFSDVAMTSDTMLSPHGLTGCLWLDRSRLRAAVKDDPHLVRTQAGATLHQLSRRLEAVGLAFQNLGGYDAQTVVGAASTGTHGSGLKFGPITSRIASWQMVVSGGNMLQIEPANGISNPELYPRPLEDDPRIKVELRQDDDLFHAVGVGIGCLGIAYAVVLQAVDLFWLTERRNLTTWRALTAEGGFLTRLIADEGRSLPSNLDHYEIYFDPYPDANGDRAALLTERYHLSTKPPSLSPERGSRTLWDLDWAVTISQLGLLGNVMDVLDHLDERTAQRVIGQVLSNMQGDFTQVGYKVFSAGDINYTRVYGIELAFPLARTPAVIARVFDIAGRLSKDNIHHPAPISLRFVANSPYFLAPQQGTATTMMEIGVPVAGRNAQKLLQTYEEELVRDFGCRPHWGLDLRQLQGSDAVRRLWPDTWDKWLAAFCQLNRSGVFDGEVTDRLGISGRKCK